MVIGRRKNFFVFCFVFVDMWSCWLPVRHLSLDNKGHFLFCLCFCFLSHAPLNYATCIVIYAVYALFFKTPHSRIVPHICNSLVRIYFNVRITYIYKKATACTVLLINTYIIFMYFMSHILLWSVKWKHISVVYRIINWWNNKW